LRQSLIPNQERLLRERVLENSSFIRAEIWNLTRIPCATF
jgi:hypothetical protein